MQINILQNIAKHFFNKCEIYFFNKFAKYNTRDVY